MLVEEHIPALQPNSRRLLLQHLFSLLQTCKSTKTLTQIHAQLIAHGAAQKSFLLVNLLSLYVSSGHLGIATRVFNRIRNPSTGVWNQMIRGLAKTSEPRKSVGIFRKMEKIGALPDGYTFCYVIDGCANGALFSEGKTMHGKVLKRWLCSDVFVRTNLVSFYSSCGAEKDALKVFDEMRDRNIVAWNSLLSGFVRCGSVEVARRVFDEMPEKNVVSWTSMIEGCARNGRCREALRLFRQMYEEGIRFDQVSLVVALSACSELGDLDKGRWIHQLAIKNLSLDKTAVSFSNTLIHMYASCGAINEAYRVFKDMTWKTTVSWTSVITGFAKQGLGNEALRLFAEMELLNDVIPDEVTFLGVMSACSHTGRVDEGWRYLHDMKHKWGIEPKIEHYGCMVDILSRAGMLEEAFKFIEAMPIKPNDLTWGTLLNGCRIHRNVELSSRVARFFSRKIEPEKAAGYVMLLSGLYSNAKRWLDAHSVKKRIDETGIIKPSGRSWVS